MSLALIEESAKEVRRLAIAGSPLAVGDFRLKKLAAPLEQAGAKVPVFAQVAKAINDVVNGPEKESAARLLNLSTLLNAILYTQGQSGAEGEFRELAVLATNCTSTRTTARLLKPVIQTLSSSGGGRMEIVKTAVERGAFNDLRLIDPAIQALGDSFPELADLVAEKILPAYGPGIVPRLKSSLDLKGKKHDARKLAVLHAVDPAGTLELCRTALEDGSADVKMAAITCLGQHVECLPLVLEQARAKNKELRAAALEALAGYDVPEVTRLFTELVNGKSLDELAGPFRSLKNQTVLNSLLGEGRRVFDLILKNGPEQIPRFCELLNCLPLRKAAAVEEFLLGCFAQSDALGKVKAAKQTTVVKGTQNPAVATIQNAFVRATQPASLAGADIVERLTALLYQLGSPKAFEAILAKRDTLSAAVFHQVLHSALRTWPADRVFTEFSPLLEPKKGKGKEKSEVLQSIFATHSGLDDDQDPSTVSDKYVWDARWLDAAIAADAEGMVCRLAKPHHEGAINYLLKWIEGKAANAWSACLAIQTLARCEYPKVTDCFLEQIAKKSKSAKHDYELRVLMSSAKHLPKADLPKLDAFAATLDEKFVDGFLEAIAPLRPATPEPETKTSHDQ